jgi:hypothetical protein
MMLIVETNSRPVKLRDHPLMIRNVTWPPQWQAVGASNCSVQGELGILQDASMHRLITNKICVTMAHLSYRYIAVLAFDDEMFTKQLYPVLLKHVGSSLREIGDLDLSHLL